MLPIPSGWFCIGASETLPRHAVRPLRFAGQDRVLFRTASGEAVLMEAYCPHLGAHMGHGGTVEGETLRCPFHGFRFDGSGACTATEYGQRPPRVRAGTVPLDEQDGLLFAWHGSRGEAPGWHLPPTGQGSWTAIRLHEIPLSTHPQEIAENSVDVGHLRAVHGYESVQEREPLRTDGPNLEARYRFRRRLEPTGRLGRLTVTIDIHQWGLGCAMVDTHVAPMGLRLRNYVLAMPEDASRTLLRIGLRVALPEVRGPVRGAADLAMRLVRDASFPGYVHDVMQDAPIWNHKVFEPRPALARGDGPIAEYRRWTEQFYPDPAVVRGTAPSEAAE